MESFYLSNKYQYLLSVCRVLCILHWVLGILFYTQKHGPCSQGTLSPAGVMQHKQYPQTHTCMHFVMSAIKEKNQALRERKTLR